jgi:hypothetical protein
MLPVVDLGAYTYSCKRAFDKNARFGQGFYNKFLDLDPAGPGANESSAL